MVPGPAFVTSMSGKLKQRNDDTMILCERERERVCTIHVSQGEKCTIYNSF